MLDDSEVNRFSADNEAVIKKQFEKLGYTAKKLDGPTKDSRPDPEDHLKHTVPYLTVRSLHRHEDGLNVADFCCAKLAPDARPEAEL